MATTPGQLRIAFFTETFVPKMDGIVQPIGRLLAYLREKGADAIIFAPGDQTESYSGFPIVSIPSTPFSIYQELAMGTPGRSVYDRLVAFKPSLIHAVDPSFTGLQGMRFARLLHIPLVASVKTPELTSLLYGREVFKQPLWAAHRFAYNRADYRLAPSIGMIKELHAYGFKPIIQWQRGVDTVAFSPKFADPRVRAQLSNGQPNKVLLLSVGPLTAERQVERLAAVLDAVPNTHLVIVGSGPHRTKLESAFSGRSVTFTGTLVGEALSKVYASCDIFICPTAKPGTPGLVDLEAMASGLAIVSSRIDGVPELIEQGRNGYMFAPDDSAQMIAYVRELSEDLVARQALAQAARDTAEQLSWDTVMDELLHNYCTMVDHYRTSRPHRRLVHVFQLPSGRS